MDRLLQDLQYIKGVGPRRSQQFHRLGLYCIFDILWNIPRKYYNSTKIGHISGLSGNETFSIRGNVVATENSHSPKGMAIFSALVKDDTGVINAIWFNQAFIFQIIKPGQRVLLNGKLRFFNNKMQFYVEEYEILQKEEYNCSIFPIYSLTEGLSQKTIRRLTLNCLREYLDYYPEIINKELRQKYRLCTITEAFKYIHFPKDRDSYRFARRRLALEELLLFQIQMKQSRNAINNNYVVHCKKTSLVKRIISNLPFSLTLDQERVVMEIFSDMEKPCQMNRLLQGDVGAGKTVIAALAMAKAVDSGFQAAIMAPTGILAEQHFRVMFKIFANSGVNISLLTGSMGEKERRLILDQVKNGKIHILIGTHALIQADVVFKQLGLVIIDEQQRFGVRQRAKLSEKGTSPDILVMTATPIPRTLALTIYSDLSLSVIKQLPPGRKKIHTRYINLEERNKVYYFAYQRVAKGAQAYIICPLVEESEKQDLQAAVSLYQELKNGIFADFNVGLIHGKLNQSKKEHIMRMFYHGQIKVLVSTIVVEVGVDVPNASIIIIEQAERFGLSQLHQLRGRVGRGSLQSYCFLLAEPKTEEAIQRLKAMENTNDGFKLAEEDLKIRGPGEFWGYKQHGLDSLKVANMLKDNELVRISHLLADDLMQGSMNSMIQEYITLKYKLSSKVAPN